MKLFKKICLHSVVVMNFAGQPVIEYKDGASAVKLSKKTELKNDAYYKTKQNELLDLKIESQLNAYLLPNSILTTEGSFLKEGYKTQVVFLRAGEVYIQNSPTEKDKTEHDAELSVKTDFFNFKIKPNGNTQLRIIVDKEKAFLKVCNTGDDTELALYDHEIKQTLAKNTGIAFQGVLDGKNIAYDLLLDKRKIPKGKWLAKDKCDNKEFEMAQTKVKDIQKKTSEKAALEEKIRLENKKKMDAQYLCHEPYGQLDQCYFQKEGSKCIRHRCNAEGNWKDTMDVNLSLCGADRNVRSCNY